MIACGTDLVTIAHQVGHDHPDAMLLVIQHDGRAARPASAKLERTIGIVSIERLAVHPRLIVRNNITMVVKHHMRGVLTCHVLADGTVAVVIVDRRVFGMGVNVVATTRTLVRHRPSSSKRCGWVIQGESPRLNPGSEPITLHVRARR
ncbi:conserved hypothetical protein [Roseovarius sp. EC-SD190]|nr:conserved hypothetical protein [Roseovarius sp. EC-SD190]